MTPRQNQRRTCPVCDQEGRPSTIQNHLVSAAHRDSSHREALQDLRAEPYGDFFTSKPVS